MSLASSSSSEQSMPSRRRSTASSSPLQMTMCRSCGGKRVARIYTSVVNEEPSGVRVKLKKGTCGSDFGASVERDS